MVAGSLPKNFDRLGTLPLNDRAGICRYNIPLQREAGSIRPSVHRIAIDAHLPRSGDADATCGLYIQLRSRRSAAQAVLLHLTRTLRQRPLTDNDLAPLYDLHTNLHSKPGALQAAHDHLGEALRALNSLPTADEVR